MLKQTDLISLAKEWNFSINEYSNIVKEIGDVCAIRHKKGKPFRRDYERGLLMIAVSIHYNCHRLLEFGTGRGFVTSCLSMLSNVRHITTIDQLREEETLGVMSESFYSDMSKVEFISKKSKNLKNNDTKDDYDLVFIDGEHTHSAVANDFKFAINHTVDDAIIVFDDYRNKHKGVKKYIKSLPYDKILVYTDGWVYDNKFIKTHGDADKVVDNKEVGSGQVILFKDGYR